MTKRLYLRGLDLKVIGGFQNHDGFDGLMLGRADLPYHFEFTNCPAHPVDPRPTEEDLLVLYIPDESEWERACARMAEAGFIRVRSFNPYWELRGRTYEDRDGYRIVLQNDAWVSQAAPSLPA